jgi:hypothetical protein
MKKIIVIIVLCCISGVAYSQNDSNKDEKAISAWKFDVAPYVWLAGSSGTISFLDQSAKVDAKFKDVLKNLKFGMFMHLEAKKGKWIVFGDLVYIKVEKAGNIEISNTPTNIELKQTLVEIGGGYNLITTLDDWLFIDAIAGLRYFEIDNLINVGQQQILDRTVNVTDPFVGIRFRTVSDKWINGARIDVGGFGIGSNISWKANLLVGYQFSELLAVSLGYQAYGIDYEKDKFGLDLISSGFATGVNFHF